MIINKITNMKENIMHWGHTPYEAPEAEVIVFAVEEGFLIDSFTGGGNGRKAAEDLEDTETDAGNAIWN